MTEITRIEGLWSRDQAAALGAPQPGNLTEIIRTDGLITRAQAAALCGVTANAITQWARRGYLPVARREGRSPLFRLLDVAKADHMITPNRHRTTTATVPGLSVDPATILAIAKTCDGDTGVPPRQPVVYYLRFADRIKIGTTVNLRSRLSDVPHDHVLAVEPGGGDVESKRHAQFATCHLHGEWFSPAPELMEHIETLRCGQSAVAD